MVWVIWPEERQIDVWHLGDSVPAETLGMDGTLDGEEVVPGFRYPVADAFADPLAGTP